MRVVPFKNIIPTCSLLEHALNPELEDIMVRRYGVVKYCDKELIRFFKREDIPAEKYRSVCHNLAVLNSQLTYTFALPPYSHSKFYLKRGCTGASIVKSDWQVKLKYLKSVSIPAYSKIYNGTVYPTFLWLGKHKHTIVWRSY